MMNTSIRKWNRRGLLGQLRGLIPSFPRKGNRKNRLPDINKMIVDIDKVPAEHQKRIQTFKASLEKIPAAQVIDYAVQYYAVALAYMDFRAMVERRLGRLQAQEIDTLSGSRSTEDTMGG